MSRLVKRSFSLAGHRTSVALEPEFWAVLQRIAARGALTLSAVVSQTDAARDHAQPLASALRLLALRAVDPEAPENQARPQDAPAGNASGTSGGED